MSYFARLTYIEYDEWFVENISPLDLADYFDEKEFVDSVHEKFINISTINLIISSTNNFH